MKVVMQTEFGPPDVLELHEVKKPSVGDEDVLIQVKAASVNYGDLLARNFKSTRPGNFSMPMLFWLFAKLYFGWNKPRISVLGNEFSGTVEAVGKKVRSFQVGDDVFGYRGQEMGAYAEYLSMPATGVLTTMPEGLGFEEATVIPYGGLVATGLLRKIEIQPGQKVLIIGASGGIGSAAVQMARDRGAEVTGVCGTPRVQYVKELGAERVIDYMVEDFTEQDERYDLIFDVLGKSSYSRCKRLLREKGVYLRASFKSPQLVQMLWTGVVGGTRVKCVLAPCNASDLKTVKGLVERGVLTARVDRIFPLEEAAKAHAYVERGKRKGPSVLVMNAD